MGRVLKEHSAHQNAATRVQAGQPRADWRSTRTPGKESPTSTHLLPPSTSGLPRSPGSGPSPRLLPSPTAPELRFQHRRRRGQRLQRAGTGRGTYLGTSGRRSVHRQPGRLGGQAKALPGLSPAESPTHRGRATLGSGVPGESGRDAGRPPLRRPIQRAAGRARPRKESGLAGRPLALSGGLPIQCLRRQWPRLAPLRGLLPFHFFPRFFPFPSL